MSKSYGYGLLNSKVNTLTSLVLTSGTSAPGLAAVLGVSDDAGQLQANNFSLISSQTVDGVYDAYLGGLDGIGVASTAGGSIALNATANCVLQMESGTNTALITTDPTQMVIQTPDFPLNLITKGIKLDGVVGAAGTVLTSNGAGLASTWTSPTLATVLAAGNTADGPITIHIPLNPYTSSVSSDSVSVQDLVDRATLQGDGVVVVDKPTGDFCQMLKNKVIFSKTAHVSEVENTATALEITSSHININGQVSFDTPPHSVDAINGNDLVTKGYCDSLVGQYSGGYNLFMNYSVVDGLYRSLGQSVVAAAPPPVSTTTDGTNQLVAQFVTSALGITSIPSGIWNVLLYSEVSAPAGIVNYYFELHQLTGATETLITTSGFSADVNSSTVPTGFPINATISAPVTVALTDKIVLKIFVHKDGTPVNVNTYFQDEYYSFSQSTLNAGTTLLSSNNTWTGTNKFVLGITSPALDTETAVPLNIGTVNTNGITIGRVGANTTVAATLITTNLTNTALQSPNVGSNISHFVTNTTGTYSLLTTNTGGIASLFTSAARTATLNIQNASTSANIVNIGSATSATNILGLRAATLDSITSSVLSVGSNVLTTGVNLNNKVLSGLTYGVNQFITLSANTAVPTASQIGYRANITPAPITGTSGTGQTTLLAFTGVNQLAAGVYIFELRFIISTASTTNISFSGLGAILPDMNFGTSVITNAILPYHGRVVFEQQYTGLTDSWIVASSSVATTISVSLIRTRIA